MVKTSQVRNLKLVQTLFGFFEPNKQLMYLTHEGNSYYFVTNPVFLFIKRLKRL